MSGAASRALQITLLAAIALALFGIALFGASLAWLKWGTLVALANFIPFCP